MIDYVVGAFTAGRCQLTLGQELVGIAVIVVGVALLAGACVAIAALANRATSGGHKTNDGDDGR